MRKPVIGLNLVYLDPGRLGGTATYALELLQQYAKMAPPFEFVLFLNRGSLDEVQPPGPQFHPVVLPIGSGSPSRRHPVEQALLPNLVRKHHVDVLHSMGYVCPILAPGRHIVTVHDMLYKRWPERVETGKRLFWQVAIPLSIRRSARVITVSEHARQDILHYLRPPASKVVAIHSGIGGITKPCPEQIEKAKNRFGISGPYVLAVGCGKHKRVDILAAAVNKLPGMRLVVTGVPESGVVPPDAPPNVKYVGFVKRDELIALYAGAKAYVTASEMEGFGLTVLEAMSVDTPVISSNFTALPEVCGDAAWIVHAADPDAYAQAIAGVCLDPEIRRGYIARGRKRVGEFSWRTCAEEHLRVYAEVANAR